MKKYFYLLLVILLLPIFVLADSAGPKILGYDAVIINPKGAKTNDGKENIPYNSKVRVLDEVDYFDDNKIYASVCYMKENECGRGFRYILLSDIVPLKEEINPSDIKGKFNEEGWSSENEASFEKSTDKFIVFEKNGIKLSKGPSDVYKKYDNTIEYMTPLKAKYVLSSGGGESSVNYWYYIEDGNNKGWLNVSSYGVYTIGKSCNTLLVAENISIYDENNKFMLNIKPETLLNNAYYIEKQKKYYIIYDENNKGFTTQDNYGFILDGIILTLKDTKVTSSTGEVIGNIPSGAQIKKFYGTYEQVERDDVIAGGIKISNKKYFYVEYGNLKGFIPYNDVISFLIYDEESEKELLKRMNKTVLSFNFDVDIHEYNNSPIFVNNPLDGKIINTIPKGTTIKSLYHTSYSDYNDETKKTIDYNLYLVNYNKTPGWIIIEKAESDDNDVIKENIPKEPDDLTKHNINPTVTKNKNNILIYAIIGSVIVSLTATVTILLINKKKKEKKQNNIDKKENLVSQNNVNNQNKVDNSLNQNETKDKNK